MIPKCPTLKDANSTCNSFLHRIDFFPCQFRFIKTWKNRNEGKNDITCVFKLICSINSAWRAASRRGSTQIAKSTQNIWWQAWVDAMSMIREHVTISLNFSQICRCENNHEICWSTNSRWICQKLGIFGSTNKTRRKAKCKNAKKCMKRWI